jgi:hypothetical protein
VWSCARRLLIAYLMASGLSACATDSGSRPSLSPSIYPTASPSGSLASPRTFSEACALEPQVCRPTDYSEPIPPSLWRKMAVPTLQRGQSCPTTHGTRIQTRDFGGVALGTGPIRPLGPLTTDGRAHVSPNLTKGWYSFKTLWFSDPSYTGAALVRGIRIDGPGQVAFGEQPTLAYLVIPPGPTINGSDGYRQAPGGTFVTQPGCYIWQVDGIDFSYGIIFEALPAGT